MHSSIGLRAALCTLAFGATASTLPLAHADETPAPSSAPPPPADLTGASAETSIDVPPPPPPAVRPPPYSLPFMLRPAAAANVVRADTSFAAYENTASKQGFTVAPTVSGAYKIPGTGEKWAGLAAIVRLAAANDSPPTGSGGFGIVNPLVAANYVVPLGGGLRAAFFLGATVPVGMGGGDTPTRALPRRARSPSTRGRRWTTPFTR